MRRNSAGSSPRPLFHPQSRDTGRRHLQSRDPARGVLVLEATIEKCMSGPLRTPRGGVGALPAVGSLPAVRPWSALRAVAAVAGSQAAAAVVPRSAVAPGTTVVMEALTAVADHRRLHRSRGPPQAPPSWRTRPHPQSQNLSREVLRSMTFARTRSSEGLRSTHLSQRSI